MVLADSDAASDPKVWSQHQAAITLLQDLVADPAVEAIGWLDLACGRGQILQTLDEQISTAGRSLIAYSGFDVSVEYATQAHKVAERLGFSKVGIEIGEMDSFGQLVSADRRFDFITVTNLAHELSIASFANLLVELVTRLSPVGVLYVYDMERLPTPELGALPLGRSEVLRLLVAGIGPMTDASYTPQVARWMHSRLSGWSFSIKRSHLGIDDAVLRERAPEGLSRMKDAAADLLRDRLRTCELALGDLTRYGSATAEETGDRERLLHEFWALHRQIGGEP